MKSLTDLSEPLRMEYLRAGRMMAKKISYHQALRSGYESIGAAMEYYRENRITLVLPGTHRKQARFLEGYGSPLGQVIQFVGKTSHVEYNLLELWDYLCSTYKDFSTVVHETTRAKVENLTPEAQTLLEKFLENHLHSPGWVGDEQPLYQLATTLFPDQTKVWCLRLAGTVQSFGVEKFSRDTDDLSMLD